MASGFMGLVKFWLVPWLGYHFWMSTFTVVHHTAPHIPFKPAGSWNAAKAQLSGTVHCDYPKWYLPALALLQQQKNIEPVMLDFLLVAFTYCDISHRFAQQADQSLAASLQKICCDIAVLWSNFDREMAWCRVEVLCHDINVHVPHHISPKIPWYNLRKATDSLRENWGEVRFS